MTQEQKAKAYDEAIERAKKLHKDAITLQLEQDIKDYEYIFPELAESEDEKIRKELLEHCINRRDGKQVCVDASDYRRWADWLFRIGKENIPNVKNDEVIRKELINFLQLPHPQFVGERKQEKWLAWLEKQGEHANFRNKIQIGDKVTRNEGGVLVNISQLNRVAKERKKQGGEQIPANSAKTCKDEREPVDKVEPKFKDEGKAEIDYCFTKMMNGEKVTPAWSEEDETGLKDTIYFLDTAKKHYASTVELDACIDWLKSLKERVTWKPCNELDEASYQVGIKRVLDNPESYGLTKYNWKPSDVQMQVLKEACDKRWEPDGLDPLYTLYEDLEKLKGE